MMNKHRLPKSIWLPGLLLLYLGGMTVWFAKDLVSNGETARLITVCAVELLIIILLFFVLRKKESENHNH